MGLGAIQLYFSQKCLQESKICESIEQVSVIILFECQNQVNQTRKAHVNNKVQDQTATSSHYETSQDRQS